MPRTTTAIDAELMLVNHQASRLPRLHPDKERLHQRIDKLIDERAEATPLRPSQVLARR